MPEIPHLDPVPYTLRHIRVGDSNAGTGTAPALNTAGRYKVLGKSTSFEELPISELITSPDLVDGTWTGRLQDAGTWTARFPNKTASDGIPWLGRFQESGRVDWVEIRRGGTVEFVGCVVVNTPTGGDGQTNVTVSGYDGAFLLKSVYERDWQVVQAPRDICEHASRVPVVVLADSLTAQNTSLWNQGGSLTYAYGTNGVTMSNGNGGLQQQHQVSTVASNGYKARMSCTLNALTVSTGYFALQFGNNMFVIENGTVAGLSTAYASIVGQSATLSFFATALSAPITFPASLVFEIDGQWARGYINGQLAGYCLADTTSFAMQILLQATVGSATVSNFAGSVWLPLLMAGTDKGDYALPGTAATFPNGGLHSRYYNDVQQQNLTSISNALYLQQVLNPKKDNPASGAPTPYDVVDTQVLTNSPGAHVTSGFATTNFSMKMFGAIWLPLASVGSITMSLNLVASNYTATRLWIGQTEFGTQLVDQWIAGNGSVNSFTVTQASMQNAAGNVYDAWYPIIIESAVFGGNTQGPVLHFTTSGWTDPGGTAITANMVVPATSLSPIGCVDQRFQGISYFDMYQQTANAFGYQFACEPKSLESGEFPGRMAPRIREGKDTDEIFQADTSDAVSPIMSYANASDATDQITSAIGIGAGINDGQGSQLQVQVYNLAASALTLFDLQGWISASDVAYSQLLAQRVASQLALQSVPFQNLTGTPRATDRQAQTWPVTGVASEFHFRPGDGVRFYLPDVGVVDTVPRQMTQVVRQFGPIGRTGSQGTPGARGLRPPPIPKTNIKQTRAFPGKRGKA